MDALDAQPHTRVVQPPGAWRAPATPQDLDTDHSVARTEALHSGTNLHHLASRVRPEDVWQRYDSKPRPRAHLGVQRAHDRDSVYAHKHLGWPRRGCRHVHDLEDLWSAVRAKDHG